MLMDDSAILWILTNGEWVYLADFVEDDLQPGQIRVFSTRNHIVELHRSPTGRRRVQT